MLIYYTAVDLETGFETLAQKLKDDRLVRGRKVSRCSGYELFKAEHEAGRPLKCWHCDRVGTQFVVNKGQNDKLGSPTLDLFSSGEGDIAVLMTRDHIIPRSYGGGDMIENLRIGCSICNGARGNTLDEADLKFMKDHPKFIVREPNPVVEQGLPKTQEEKRKMRAAARKRRKARQKADRESRFTTTTQQKSKPPLFCMTACAILGCIT